MSSGSTNSSIDPGLRKLLLFSLVLLLALMDADHARAQSASDPWLEEMKNARGLTAGDLTPKYGDMPGSSSSTDGSGGAGNTGRPTGTGTEISGQDAGPVDPNSVDPNNPQAAGYIQQWIAVAEPPENAVPGSSWRYDKFGRMVGSGPGVRTIQSGTHDSVSYSVGTPEETVWSLRQKLDSINHCTLEEYVVAKISRKTIAHCAGRYGAVKDLRGLAFSEAKALLASKGFSYTLEPGSPAETPEEEETIEKQKPPASQYLKKGATITLFVHAPYVPKTAALPDFTGRSLQEAKQWLKDKGLTMELEPGSSSPSRNLAGTVERQYPEPGTQVGGETSVSLRVYSDFVESVMVPDVTGLSVDQAKARLAQMGLGAESQTGSQPGKREQAGIVERQEPQAGTTVVRGYTARVWSYGAYVPSREEQIAAHDCSNFPNSRPGWDDSLNGPRCFCSPGFILNMAKDRCVSIQARAQEICESKWPGSGTVTVWNASKNAYDCGCPSGMEWDRTKRYCISNQAAAQEICESKWPGSGTVTVWNASKNAYDCGCPSGMEWDLNNRYCISIEEKHRLICQRDRPGSVPAGRAANGTFLCDCPSGQVFDNSGRCVVAANGGRGGGTTGENQPDCEYDFMMIKIFMDNYRHNPSQALQKQMAEDNARSARNKGCDEGRIQQALGGGGGRGNGVGGGVGRRGGGSGCWWIRVDGGIFGQDFIKDDHVSYACVCGDSKSADDSRCAHIPKPRQ